MFIFSDTRLTRTNVAELAFHNIKYRLSLLESPFHPQVLARSPMFSSLAPLSSNPGSTPAGRSLRWTCYLSLRPSPTPPPFSPRTPAAHSSPVWAPPLAPPARSRRAPRRNNHPPTQRLPRSLRAGRSGERAWGGSMSRAMNEGDSVAFGAKAQNKM